MAVEAVIGSPFTFQVMFLDSSNLPVVVVDPRITIYQFSGAGAKQILVANVPLVPVFPAEPGRYVYVYTIPIAFQDGTTIYGEMTGTDPAPGGILLWVQEVVTAIAATRSGAGYTGLTARFI
jgi:hypothetical protein